MLDRPAIDADALLAAIADLTDQVRALHALVEARVGVADDGDDMWVAAVAMLVHRTPETVRTWCDQHGIGSYDAKSRRYVISRQKLRAFLIDRFGVVPDGL